MRETEMEIREKIAEIIRFGSGRGALIMADEILSLFLTQQGITEKENPIQSPEKIEKLRYYYNPETKAGCIFPSEQEKIDKINEIIDKLNDTGEL
jgi:hypothetical protein